MSTPSQYNFPDTTVSENFSRVIYFTENPATDRLFIPVNAPADQGGIEYGGAGTGTSNLVGGTGYSAVRVHYYRWYWYCLLLLLLLLVM